MRFLKTSFARCAARCDSKTRATKPSKSKIRLSQATLTELNKSRRRNADQFGKNERGGASISSLIDDIHPTFRNNASPPPVIPQSLSTRARPSPRPKKIMLPETHPVNYSTHENAFALTLFSLNARAR